MSKTIFDCLTDRARRVLNHAKQAALLFNHDYIGTEHILLGLVMDTTNGIAVTVLKNLNINADKVRYEISRIVKPGSDKPADSSKSLPFTPRSKTVLEQAMNEAVRLKHNYIGTEHLLLGVIAENEGIAAQILINMGVKLDEAREEVLEFLGAPEEEEKPRESYDSFISQRREVVDAVKPRKNESVLSAILRVAATLESAVQTIKNIRLECMPMGTDCGDSAVVKLADDFLKEHGEQASS